MAPEVAVSVAFPRTLATGNELHRDIDQKSIGQGFQFQFSGLFRVRIFRLDSINPQPRQRSSQSSQSDIGAVLIELKVSVRQVLFGPPVSSEESPGSC